MLTLVEHRRCVPEIIGFSDQIAYEPDGARLIPVWQFGADRLDPLRTVFVKDGYERGSSTSRTNPPEVDAIVDQIQKWTSIWIRPRRSRRCGSGWQSWRFIRRVDSATR